MMTCSIFLSPLLMGLSISEYGVARVTAMLVRGPGEV